MARIQSLGDNDDGYRNSTDAFIVRSIGTRIRHSCPQALHLPGLPQIHVFRTRFESRS